MRDLLGNLNLGAILTGGQQLQSEKPHTNQQDLKNALALGSHLQY